MPIFDENLDRSALSDRDQAAWLRVRHHDGLRWILELLHQAGYMAMAQAAQIYGGSAANARREIRSRLVAPGLVGQAEIRGNAYLYIRPAGARLVTGDNNAVGVAAVPEKPDRVLPIAFTRIEWWLTQKPGTLWKQLPGMEVLGLRAFELATDRPIGPVCAAEFRATLSFRGGVWCMAVRWTHTKVTVLYIVVDLGRSRSAYRELITRIRASATTLYAGAKVQLLIMAGNQRRADALVGVIRSLHLTPPLVVDETAETDCADIWDMGYDNYTTYGFHRK